MGISVTLRGRRGRRPGKPNDPILVDRATAGAGSRSVVSVIAETKLVNGSSCAASRPDEQEPHDQALNDRCPVKRTTFHFNPPPHVPRRAAGVTHALCC